MKFQPFNPDELNAYRRYIAGNPAGAHLNPDQYSLYEAHLLQP